MLAPWELEVIRSVNGECALTGLLTASILPPEQMDEALAEVYPDKVTASKFVSPPVLLARDFEGVLVSTDGSAKPPEKGGDGSFAFVAWKLPTWEMLHAESFFASPVTVNEAEYKGIMAAVRWALEEGIRCLTIAGDSCIAIQQLQGSLGCHKENLQALLAEVTTATQNLETVNYLHVPRVYNQAADSLATDALVNKQGRQVDSPAERTELGRLNQLQAVIYLPAESSDVQVMSVMAKTADVEDVQGERLMRIAQAQDEETRWYRLKAFILFSRMQKAK